MNFYAFGYLQKCSCVYLVGFKRTFTHVEKKKKRLTGYCSKVTNSTIRSSDLNRTVFEPFAAWCTHAYSNSPPCSACSCFEKLQERKHRNPWPVSNLLFGFAYTNTHTHTHIQVQIQSGSVPINLRRLPRREKQKKETSVNWTRRGGLATRFFAASQED